MVIGVRKLLRQNMSRTNLQRLDYLWWYCKHYLPCRTASPFVKRAPLLHGRHSELLEELSNINVFAPTLMCRIMTKHGSDKGNSWHNYTAIYSRLLGKLQDRNLRIFELGLCRIDQREDSASTGDGRPGASLRGWREIFPNSEVFGADIERSILFTEERIRTYYCDQLDSDAISDLWEHPELKEGMDILVEDGLHTFLANISFLAGSLDHVKIGGMYFVEDIAHSELPRWHDQLSLFTGRYPNYDFVLAELPNSLNFYDNNMLIARRHS